MSVTSTHGTTEGEPAVAQEASSPGWRWARPEPAASQSVSEPRAPKRRLRASRLLDGALVLAGGLVAVWIGMTAPAVSPTAPPVGHSTVEHSTVEHGTVGHSTVGQGNVDLAGSSAGDPGAGDPPESETSPLRDGPGR